MHRNLKNLWFLMQVPEVPEVCQVPHNQVPYRFLRLGLKFLWFLRLTRFLRLLRFLWFLRFLRFVKFLRFL